MHTYSFEKLEVWQLARKFVGFIYQITKIFPPEEKYGLVTQIRRASLSIASNIAEGSGRKSKKDQSNFYQMAYGSAMEVLNQVIISLDLKLMPENDYFTCRSKLEELSMKLYALKKAASS